MFIISVNYKVSLEIIDSLLNDHIEFLKEQYELGHFEISGRKIPRNGGVIISNVKTKEILESIIIKDPFHINNLAEYEIIEFIPTMTSALMQTLRI